MMECWSSCYRKRLFFISIGGLLCNILAFSDVRSSNSHDGAFGVKTSTEGTRTASAGVVTIPLVPYHVYRRRNLKAALEYEKQNRKLGYPTRRRRYHHRNLNHIDGHNDEQSYSAEQVAGLYQGYGTHYADLWCGSPSQRQTVIVDTGSGNTAFPCSQCNECGVPDYHIDPLFNEHNSSTFRALTCDECLYGSCWNSSCSVGVAYQEGSSWNAFEASDNCYIGGLHNSALDVPKADDQDNLNPYNARLYAFNLIFGCQTKATNLFVTQLEAGIVGMNKQESSFWFQMYNATKIKHRSFSLCFNRKNEVDPEGTESGAMSLGGTDPRLHVSPMVYATTTESSGLYNVEIKKVWLREAGGGDSATPTKSGLKHITVDLSQTDIGQSARVIVDSGTTNTYFSYSFGSAFAEAWKELTGNDYSNSGLSISAEELDKTMPTIIIQLNGDVETNTAVREGFTGGNVTGLAGDLDPDNYYDVLLAIPPSHYFEYHEETMTYESGFFVDDSSGGVIGANSIMGHDVYFDIARNRLGWAESKCDYTSLIAPYLDGGNITGEPGPAPTVSGNVNNDKNNSNGDNNTGNGSNRTDTNGDGTDSKKPTSDGFPGGMCSDCTFKLLATSLFTLLLLLQFDS